MIFETRREAAGPAKGSTWHFVLDAGNLPRLVINLTAKAAYLRHIYANLYLCFFCNKPYFAQTSGPVSPALNSTFTLSFVTSPYLSSIVSFLVRSFIRL